METGEETAVRRLAREEYPQALDLARRVFAESVAAEYTPQGVETFYAVLRDRHFLAGMGLYGAFVKERLVGMLGLRGDGHILLFFVAGPWQRKGIGRRLLRRASGDTFHGELRVEAAPNAVAAYRHLGFLATGAETTENGVRFTPMVRFAPPVP